MVEEGEVRVRARTQRLRSLASEGGDRGEEEEEEGEEVMARESGHGEREGERNREARGGWEKGKRANLPTLRLSNLASTRLQVDWVALQKRLPG